MKKPVTFSKRSIIKYAIVSLLTVGCQIVMSEKINSIIDVSGTMTSGIMELIQPFFIAIFAIIMYQVFLMIKSKIQNTIMYKWATELKKTVFSSFFRSGKSKKSVYISIFCNDIPMLKENYCLAVLKIIEISGIVLLISIAIIIIHYFLFFVIIALSVFGFGISQISQKSITSQMTGLSYLHDKELEIMDNYLSGYVAIKSLQAEEKINMIYNQHSQILEEKKFKYFYKMSCLSAVFEGISFINIMIITLVGVILITRGAITLGNLINIIILSNILIVSIPTLLMAVLEIKSTREIWGKIIMLLAQEENHNLRVLSFEQLKVSGLKIQFEEKTLIPQIDCVIRRGEKICIIGNNGSGKSSFVSCLCGLQEYQGIIQYNSYNIAEIDAFKTLHFVGSVPFIFPETVHFNIFLNAEKQRCNIDELLKIFDLTKLYKQRKNDVIDSKTLSGGEQQKIALLRSILQNPDVLILDESLSMIDSKSRHRIIAYLIKSACTLIHITHDRTNLDLYDQVISLSNNTC